MDQVTSVSSYQLTAAWNGKDVNVLDPTTKNVVLTQEFEVEGYIGINTFSLR